MRIALCVRVLGCTLIILLLAIQSYAHAILVDSNPATEGVVQGPNIILTLKFNVRIDAARSQLHLLLLPEGKTVTLHAKPGISSNILSAETTNIMPGKYKIVWQVLASDGHITRGEIPFSAK
jgi:methionine-rich copper-binding protein CopC